MPVPNDRRNALTDVTVWVVPKNGDPRDARNQGLQSVVVELSRNLKVKKLQDLFEPRVHISRCRLLLPGQRFHAQPRPCRGREYLNGEETVGRNGCSGS